MVNAERLQEVAHREFLCDHNFPESSYFSEKANQIDGILEPRSWDDNDDNSDDDSCLSDEDGYDDDDDMDRELKKLGSLQFDLHEEMQRADSVSLHSHKDECRHEASTGHQSFRRRSIDLLPEIENRSDTYGFRRTQNKSGNREEREIRDEPPPQQGQKFDGSDLANNAAYSTYNERRRELPSMHHQLNQSRRDMDSALGRSFNKPKSILRNSGGRFRAETILEQCELSNSRRKGRSIHDSWTNHHHHDTLSMTSQDTATIENKTRQIRHSSQDHHKDEYREETSPLLRAHSDDDSDEVYCSMASCTNLETTRENVFPEALQQMMSADSEVSHQSFGTSVWSRFVSSEVLLSSKGSSESVSSMFTTMGSLFESALEVEGMAGLDANSTILKKKMFTTLSKMTTAMQTCAEEGTQDEGIEIATVANTTPAPCLEQADSKEKTAAIETVSKFMKAMQKTSVQEDSAKESIKKQLECEEKTVARETVSKFMKVMQKASLREENDKEFYQKRDFQGLRIDVESKDVDKSVIQQRNDHPSPKHFREDRIGERMPKLSINKGKASKVASPNNRIPASIKRGKSFSTFERKYKKRPLTNKISTSYGRIRVPTRVGQKFIKSRVRSKGSAISRQDHLQPASDIKNYQNGKACSFNLRRAIVLIVHGFVLLGVMWGIVPMIHPLATQDAAVDSVLLQPEEGSNKSAIGPTPSIPASALPGYIGDEA